MLSSDEVLKQSKAAFGQWEDIWRSNAKKNGELYKKNGRLYKDLLYQCVGRNLLCVAFGNSFFKNIDTIAQYKDNVMIACVDKCLGYLLDAGVKPHYVFIADAGISYEKWMEPWKDQTDGIILLSNVNANPEWPYNWKGPVYFYVNKDNIQSEEIFSEISGCREVIPASSNVGNTVVVFSTQVLGCREMYLVGYDFCWKENEPYYSHGATDSDKRYWMKHAATIDFNGDYANTSQNLLFSARWLSDFLNSVVRGRPIYNCSGQGILATPRADLKKKLKNSKFEKATEQEKQDIMKAFMETIHIPAGPSSQELLQQTLQNNNVAEVIVNHIPKPVLEFLEAV